MSNIKYLKKGANNMNTAEERLSLFMEIKRKRIKLKQIAQYLQVSNAWVTNYFGEKQVSWSVEHEQKMKQFIEQYSK